MRRCDLRWQDERGGPSACRQRRRRWRGSGGPVALLAVLLVAVGGDGRGEAADALGGAGPAPAQTMPAAVAVTPLAPLTVLGTGTEALTCVQSSQAADTAGRLGALVPQVGVTVIRGSAAPSPSITWVVVPAGRRGEAGPAVTICVPVR